MDRLISRFVTTLDEQQNDFVFDLPEACGGRPYEYAWASKFVAPEATVLDAACGVENPLKFHLAETCESCHACDLDRRLLDQTKMRSLTRAAFGEEATAAIFRPDRQNVRYSVASLMDLPYPDATFDRIFSISALEHLEDRFNKFPLLRVVRPFLPLARQDIFESLVEFKRVLAPDGLIVLTFDFPRINLSYLTEAVRRADLEFASDVDFELPRNAVHSKRNGLNCFRAVLCHDASSLQFDPVSIPCINLPVPVSA